MADPRLIDSTTEMVLGKISQAISSRHEAADVLHNVAELGSAGCFPSDVTCERLGRALYRIVMNAPEEDALLKVLKGWSAAEHDHLEDCAGHSLP